MQTATHVRSDSPVPVPALKSVGQEARHEPLCKYLLAVHLVHAVELVHSLQFAEHFTGAAVTVVTVVLVVVMVVVVVGTWTTAPCEETVIA